MEASLRSGIGQRHMQSDSARALAEELDRLLGQGSLRSEHTYLASAQAYPQRVTSGTYYGPNDNRHGGSDINTQTRRGSRPLSIRGPGAIRQIRRSYEARHQVQKCVQQKGLRQSGGTRYLRAGDSDTGLPVGHGLKSSLHKEDASQMVRTSPCH